MLELQRKQKTKDSLEVKHQDHFRCMITCRYCGKRRHYEDECLIKRRESQEHRKAEEQKGHQACKGNPGGGRRSSAPFSSGRGGPNPVSKVEQPGDKRIVPSTPTAARAEKDENAKKRKLEWHSKCLQAGGVEVKFHEER